MDTLNKKELKLELYQNLQKVFIDLDNNTMNQKAKKGIDIWVKWLGKECTNIRVSSIKLSGKRGDSMIQYWIYFKDGSLLGWTQDINEANQYEKDGYDVTPVSIN